MPANTQSDCATGSATLRDWPHGPPHRLYRLGTYLITTGIYQNRPYFNSSGKLTILTNLLFMLAERYDRNLHAWAVFPNHYHFLADSQKPETLRRFVQELHSRSAIETNRLDMASGRKVWFQYWDSAITFHRSFLARMNYVHQNPVRHKIVPSAEFYAWCSMGWFRRKADRSYCRTVKSFPVDSLNIPDNFEVPASETWAAAGPRV